MNTIEIHQKLQEALGDAVGPLSEPKVDAFAVVKADRIVEACAWLKKAPGIEIDFLQDLVMRERWKDKRRPPAAAGGKA
jgi:NADH-quinone oxidoreductase subunit C